MKQFFWGISRKEQISIIFLVTIIISNLAAFLPNSWLEHNPVLQVLLSQIVLAFPMALFLIGTKTPYRQQVKLNKMKISSILLTILFGWLIQPVLTLVNGISMSFSVNTTNSFMLNLSEQVPWYIGLALCALLPAILEESIYRGVYYQEYRKISPWKAVIFSGFLFGLMHGNLNQFCYAFLVGIIYALMMEATGSILSTMILHFMMNAGSVMTLYLLPKVYDLIAGMAKLLESSDQLVLAEYYKSLLGGDLSMTSSEWMHWLLEEGSTRMNLTEVLVQYTAPAILFGALAFLVYRSIARRNGTWEDICKIYRNNTEQSEPLLSVPMMIAIAIGVISIFVFETLVRFPR